MNRLGVLVEGPTELEFVQGLLCPYLATKNVAVWARAFGPSGGGIVQWGRALHRICSHLKQDPTVHVTTFVDYYGLPESWPGRSTASSRPYSERGAHIAQHLSAEVFAKLGDSWSPSRFIPFVMIHEFETLLFSDPDACARAWARPEVAPALNDVRRQFSNPEEINDSPSSAPSKRLLSIFESLAIGRYVKPLYGNLAVLELGMETLVAACPQFCAWLRRLEGLGTA